MTVRCYCGDILETKMDWANHDQQFCNLKQDIRKEFRLRRNNS